MKILSVRRLRGPNVYLARPVAVARLRLDELAGQETTDLAGFPERLLRALPGLAEHRCAAGGPGEFVSRMRVGTCFGHVTEHVCVELSRRIGREVSFGRTVASAEPGQYDLVVECPVDESPDSTLPAELLDAAVEAVTSVAAVLPDFDLAQRLAELAAVSERQATGPGTRSVVAAARRRGIPVERYGDLGLLRLGWGNRRRLAWDARTDRTSGVGVDIAGDRQVTRRLLAEAGVPVVPGGAANTAEQAVRLFNRLGAPVVVKARRGRPGEGIALDLGTPDEVERAFAAAGGDVVVERQLPGRDYRVLVVADAVVAAAERMAAPSARGGASRDVTDRVHPDVARLCRRVAALVGLDIAGVDLRLADVAEPVPAGDPTVEPAGGVVEVTAAPGLLRHLAPEQGPARDVGDAIVRAMFPGGSNGRIPAAAVTGTNGKTSVARLAAHLLAGTQRVGLTTSDGVSIDGRLIHRGDATGPGAAQMVLGDPGVQAVVLETGRGATVRGGLGYDWTDVGVITNITADHLGQDGADSIEDRVRVEALIAERVRDGGTLVLNADDPWVRGLVDLPRVRADRKRVVWFGLDPRHPVLTAHLAGGGTAYLLADGWLVQATGARRTPLVRAADVPGAFGGAAGYAVANALAALAAARALGTAQQTALARLAEFDPPRHNPGRGTLLRVGEVSVFVDDARDPAALAAVLRTLHRLWGAERCLAAVTLPGDRRDDVLALCAQVLADGLTRVVLYDGELRGRAPGEVPALVEREMLARRPELTPVRAGSDAQALDAVLRLAQPGDVVLLLHGHADAALGLLHGRGARPAEAGLAGAAR
ncbi:cyanophycin synthetase [Krasilnikovia cinnamomea]|uniref:Cyanophycin synthetase n=1 Tax=Krasilnikovia cinnamomea TaxID=349313 RepID=A0A4Q7ZFT0_9ACTN|nr:Mur ligase family protein [Krasilnikovia cinnamomea]RZU48993.1 cyanophycin synthetase [Krasilnikovia cinnamomea]